MKEFKKPKRKRLYYIYQIGMVILTVYLSSFFTLDKWGHKLIFGLIIPSIIIRMLYQLFSKKPKLALFSFKTQLDNLSIILKVIIGLVFIIMSITNSDFMNKLNFEWINFLIIGSFLIYNGITNQNSLVFLLKTPKSLELEEYDFIINHKTKEIIFTPNNIIINQDGENYSINELSLSKEISDKFSVWITKNMKLSDIKIQWTDSLKVMKSKNERLQ